MNYNLLIRFFKHVSKSTLSIIIEMAQWMAHYLTSLAFFQKFNLKIQPQTFSRTVARTWRTNWTKDATLSTICSSAISATGTERSPIERSSGRPATGSPTPTWKNWRKNQMERMKMAITCSILQLYEAMLPSC